MNGEVEMIQCFFNRSHMIYRSRYPYHYQRCSRQHPHIKHKLCPYDATHVMKPEVYDSHLLKCETKPLQLTNKPTTAQPTAKPLIWKEDENTCWATKEPVVAEPLLLNQRFVYRPLIGGSKAERRQHRYHERLQYNENENNRQANEAQANDDKKKKKKKKKSSNSKSNSENVNDPSGNKPIPANAQGKAPLAEQKNVTPDNLNIGKLSIKD